MQQGGFDVALTGSAQSTPPIPDCWLRPRSLPESLQLLKHLLGGNRRGWIVHGFPDRARPHRIATPINEAIVRVIKGREAAPRRAASIPSETMEEPSVPEEPRNGRWGVPS